jgi:hypothetical protein
VVSKFAGFFGSIPFCDGSGGADASGLRSLVASVSLSPMRVDFLGGVAV